MVSLVNLGILSRRPVVHKEWGPNLGEVEMVSVLPQYAGFMALLRKMGTYVGKKGHWRSLLGGRFAYW